MNDLLIDPFLLSPPDHPSPSDAERFINRVVTWPTVARNLGFRLVISDNYVIGLITDGNYPTFSSIKVLCGLGENPLDAHTVHRSLEGLVNKASRIDHELNVSQVLLDDEQHAIDPKLLFERLSTHISEALLEALALCGMHTLATGKSYPTALLTELPVDHTYDVIKAELAVLEVTLNENQHMKLPARVLMECPLIQSEEALWINTNFQAVATDPRIAIEWSWRRAIHPDERSHYPLCPFRINPEFIKNLAESSLNDKRKETMYRRLAGIVCKKPLRGAQGHALRTGEGGNDPQAVRGYDGAKAMRVPITQGNGAYRVHYWDCPDGSIEIASLGPHNSFHIPE